MPDKQKPSQHEVARGLMTKGYIFVQFDPEVPGVVIPPHLMRQGQVSLTIGHNMPIPIPDLLLTEIGFTGTLSFSQVPFTCTVPWWAVYCISDRSGRGALWPDQMPPSVRVLYDAHEASKPVAEVISMAEWRAKRAAGKAPAPKGAA